MDIKDYVKKYNLPFDKVKSEFDKDFNSLFESEKEWLENLENKIHLLKNEKNEAAVKQVIQRLKGNNIFKENDTQILSTFVSKVNTIVRIANRINNFKEGTLIDNSSTLKLHDFFNSVKASQNLNSFNYQLNSNLDNFVPHIYSVIKHCQKPLEYPIYYKYWKNILREVLSKEDDYESMCTFYRSFPSYNRHLNFATYLGTIGIQIAKNIDSIGIQITKDSKEYKYLIKDVINIERYNSILDEKLSLNQSKIMEDYTVVNEFISKVNSNEINAANSIKSLVLKDNFKENLKIVDELFFEQKLKEISQSNYNEIIDYIKSIHKINSGNYNDFNIWSASKSFLKQTNSDFIQRHEELNNEVGFPDNGNGIYKSFLGEKNLISYIKDRFENNSFSTKRYWLYAPGENASKWEEFFRDGIMALGWDEIGDLTQYSSRNEIKNALVDAYGGNGSKKNDVSANDDFLNKIKIGDVVIAKKGRGELLGYGIISTDYSFDNNLDQYRHIRKIEWKLKGNWKVDFSLVLKTLTDITKYSSDDADYNTYYEKLLGIMGKNNKTEKIEDMQFPLNTILYGPPGTGKTYNTILRAAQIIENRAIYTYDEALQVFKANLHDKIEFITFHQNYSYEDFIQGLRPDTENNNQLTFERKDGVFKEIADKALKNLTESEKPQLSKRPFEEVFNQFINPLVEGEIEEIEVKMKKVSYFITAISNKSIDFRKASGGTAHSLSIGTLKKMYLAESALEIQGLSSYYTPLLNELLELGKDSTGKKEKIKRQNYVIIIDEINRANISRVFGELITLIEPDKRSHGTIPLEARLPSGDPFIVPSNLFIIGTMNTADKSIALLDIALRRRFEFESMYPKYEIADQEIYDVEILEKINKQIIKSKGHDFQIGHAYFMGDNKDLLQRMNKKVIPLLLEYYMNDEKEVKGILNSAGLIIQENSWPLKISGKND
jgi:5-methylcytosine-specific restriction protein B